MATLTNTKIKDTYPALLKASDNGVIGATEKVITDGLGNDSVLKLGTASASFTSDIEVNGLTIGKGSGDVTQNTAVGFSAVGGTGIGNTGVGYASLLANTTGAANSALGLNSLRYNTSGAWGSAVGYEALKENTTGQGNTALGAVALQDNTIGSYNTAVGYISLANNIDGGDNTAIGYNSLGANTTGDKNVAVGSQALSTQTTGNFSTAVGYEALRFQTTGSNNTAVGYASMRTNTTGAYNTAIGIASLYENTEGQNNVAVGYNSANSNTTGNYNTALGSAALYANVIGGSNVALGYHALRNNTASNNTAVGSGALADNTNGESNVAVGRDALNANTTGSNTVAIGRGSMSDATSGNDNTAVGFYSLVNNEASKNTAIGHFAMLNNTTGAWNTAVGAASLDSNTTGGFNSSLGYNSLTTNTTGAYNTGIGNSALLSNSTGSRNTALGYYAGDTITTGTDNLYIGYQADASAVDVENEIVIGASATGNGSNTATYGNSSVVEHHFTAGDVYMNADLYGVEVLGNEFGPTEYVDLTGNSISLGAGGSDRLVIDSSGNLAVDTNTLYVDAANNRVGVGTSSPAAGSLLDVNGDIKLAAGAKIKFNDDRYFSPENNVDGAEISANGIFKVKTGATPTERFRIDSSGNVGINTSPVASRKLHIDGGSISADTPTVRISSTDSSGTNKFGIEFYSNSGADVRGKILADNNGRVYIDDNGGGGVVIQANGGSGNVGIGTSSPAAGYLLDVNGGINMAYSGAGSNAINQSTASGFGNIKPFSNAGFFDFDTNFSSGGGYRFHYNGGEKMRIDSSGNVGIGTSPSGAKLHTYTTGTQDNILKIQNGTNGYANQIQFMANNDGGAIYNAISSNTLGGSQHWRISGGTAANTFAVSTGGTERMRIDSSGNVTLRGNDLDLDNGTTLHRITNSNTDLLIRADYNNTSANSTIQFSVDGTERMRITSGGQVEINRTSDLGNGFLEINGSASRSAIACNQISTATSYQIYFSNPNGIVGSISTSASSTAYNTSSDYRLKENVVEMTGALDRVDALKPSRFNFIADPENTVDGFLAHEVQAIVPEAVTGEKDAVDEEGNPIYQGIDQSKIVPLLVGAIKELKAEIELLKSQLS